MGLCVRCARENVPSARICSACGARLPQLETDEAPRLDLEEGREYLTPTQSYDTENLFQLQAAIEDYLAGEPLEPVVYWVRQLRRYLEEFARGAVPQLFALLGQERELDPDNDFPHQVQYLVNKGLAGYREGLDRLESFLQSLDSEALESALAYLQEGNDNICLGLQLVARRKQELESIS